MKLFTEKEYYFPLIGKHKTHFINLDIKRLLGSVIKITLKETNF